MNEGREGTGEKRGGEGRGLIVVLFFHLRPGVALFLNFVASGIPSDSNHNSFP